MLADPRGNWSAALCELQAIVDTDEQPRVVAWAKMLLADAFVKGRGGLASGERARDYYIDAAQAGVPGAYLGVGRWYEAAHRAFGTGAPNFELAAQMYEEGVRAGSSTCAVSLARLHLHGRLLRSSTSLAEHLLRRAAASGDRSAQRELKRLKTPGPSTQIAHPMRVLNGA